MDVSVTGMTPEDAEAELRRAGVEVAGIEKVEAPEYVKKRGDAVETVERTACVMKGEDGKVVLRTVSTPADPAIP